MGVRVLRVNPAILVALCQRPARKLVTACTANALPEDAAVVFVRPVKGSDDHAHVELILRSDEWDGGADDLSELPAPVIETFDLAIALEGG